MSTAPPPDSPAIKAVAANPPTRSPAGATVTTTRRRPADWPPDRPRRTVTVSTAAAHGTPPPTPRPSRRAHRRSVAATVVGNFVESFDWLAFGLFAPLFAARFFPSSNPVTSLLGVFAVLGVGVLVRPVGGILLGRLADRRGRKPALLLSISLMTAGSLLIAVTPGYQQIGLLAPLLLLLARIAQGISHGGEWPAATAYLMEVAPAHRKCLYGGLFSLTAAGGAFTASLLGAGLTGTLSEAAMASWGWRVPFLVGGLFGVALLLVRNRLAETEVFQREVRGHAARGSLRLLLSGHRRQVLLAVLFAAGLGTVGGSWTSVVPAMGQRLAGPGTMFWVVVCVTGTVMVVQVPIGLLADRVGADRFLVCAALVFAALGPWAYLNMTGTFLSLLLAYGSGVVYLMSATTVLPKLLSEIFPAQLRALGMGLPYALTSAVLGGIAPVSATYLADRGASGWFTAAVAGMVLLGLPATALARGGQRGRVMPSSRMAVEGGPPSERSVL
ncbi:MFS transporter [Streptomyces katsurahamanus]|uniref:MFS transporter n=1 Tax=Streptomyces katsurahamanus TaxID=2577098 RepID=A0ABW9NRQ6_9ACTN|nr:MFS transporter [Streptomyces katsurahamanus]